MPGYWRSTLGGGGRWGRWRGVCVCVTKPSITLHHNRATIYSFIWNIWYCTKLEEKSINSSILYVHLYLGFHFHLQVSFLKIGWVYLYILANHYTCSFLKQAVFYQTRWKAHQTVLCDMYICSLMFACIFK